MTEISVKRFRTLSEQALLKAGASAALAASLLEATLSAERAGRREVGAGHLPAYLVSLRDGRINGAAVPVLASPMPAVIASDAQGGIAQLGFDMAFADLVSRAETFGLATFTQRNSYTTGELGYYVRRLAQKGLVAIAATNAHAMMASKAGGAPVFSTNPLAFAAPRLPPHGPLVIDQSSSATAFVNLARAAAENRPIPEGWATDAKGAPTNDAREAMRGALLPFGGYKGANLALMVEMLAAGMTGADWSFDMGNFQTSDRFLNAGLWVMAMKPIDTGDFSARAAKQYSRLQSLAVHLPGSGSPPEPFAESDVIDIDSSVLALLAPDDENA
ncbi:Ldh family oxidoreductase [Mesorhizobium sp. RP14(2022)]|uniref:Ldh family oxidoreductase n=1 Tax=Mesorhizobium liriopis TaxID=2953882 RepID=A0ABT1C4D0_9HYPH|nr:Ldh family oxidoreductase [Mesorhizobium liriopis]MCO6049669.1 Ldh family oxidoreductase [Mesorhizobium liriopis]